VADCGEAPGEGDDEVEFGDGVEADDDGDPGEELEAGGGAESGGLILKSVSWTIRRR
jgi:hypothetical protein